MLVLLLLGVEALDLRLGIVSDKLLLLLLLIHLIDVVDVIDVDFGELLALVKI